MPVTKKTTTATPAAAPAPTKAEAPKKVAAPKAEATAPVAEAAAPTEPTGPSALDNLETKITALVALLKEVQVELKVVKKENERMKKIVERTEAKRAKARSNPNGFAKPSKITDELCDFLAVPRGTMLSRTDVTRKVNAYIKDNKLNKPENKRIINPDTKLRKILGIKPDEELSYFSLQRYLSRSFVKA
jgi:chromatin remodeling complex protein RSC6